METESPIGDWDHCDPRWRGCEYIDYVPITGPVTMATRPHLGSITRVRFAPEQPAEFAHFAGRLADLAINHLNLDHYENWRLRFGLATTGVRVPGTPYVLRVARPWYAYFEERAGEFHTLPDNWMECVHLIRCPGGGIEWLGRRHPMANSAWFDLSAFAKMPSGWKWQRAEFPRAGGGVLGMERAYVIFELHTFERSLLSAIAERSPEVFPAKRIDRLYAPLHPLADWQAAARRLIDALTADIIRQPVIYNAAEFHGFLSGEPDAAFDFQEGRIRYLMNRNCWDWRLRKSWLPAEHQPQDPDDKDAVLAAMKNRVLGPLPRECDLWNALYGTLPVLAIHDLDFVRKMLSPKLWRERVLAKTVLTEVEGQDQPPGINLSDIFQFLNHRLGGAVGCVIRSLAANDFTKLGPFLNHPLLDFEQLQSIPSTLFEALFAKVQVITDLRLCWGQLLGQDNTESMEVDNER